MNLFPTKYIIMRQKQNKTNRTTKKYIYPYYYLILVNYAFSICIKMMVMNRDKKFIQTIVKIADLTKKINKKKKQTKEKQNHK